MEYIAYLHKDRKSDFGVSFPDFPGCVTAGTTLDEARRMAVAFLVNVDVAERAERFNITARKSQMEEIDRRAKKKGMTRSA